VRRETGIRRRGHFTPTFPVAAGEREPPVPLPVAAPFRALVPGGAPSPRLPPDYGVHLCRPVSDQVVMRPIVRSCLGW